MALVPAVAFGAQQQNLRGNAGRSGSAAGAANANRNGTGVAAERSARGATNARSATNRSATTTRSGVVSRSAKAQPARVATTPTVEKSNASRAATTNKARATAVFNDVSKIGGGYAACRDSYATCMDQFCAAANDAYRRCFCSDRFMDFRKTADSLDTALNMLADFQNTNLDAVDKTAAEVNAMYSASEGESAIKRDTSGAQKLLDKISDLLTGKKSSNYKSSTSGTSTGILDLSTLFSSSGEDGDIWGGSSSIFDLTGSSNYANMSEMEGAELYDAANRQCSAITRNECSGDAVFNLARSAYSIMITQDCNVYEKSINAKRESVKNTVRTAEKYLREARLEEYRAHNSADVNACLDQVETALRSPTACGENYEKCMDYSGRYINMNTGEPIYSKALFDLNNLIVLDGSPDVLAKNPKFDKFLEEKKIFATTALDSCRDISDTVWYEFKRSALIQISQAQDEKLEEVKNSCVETIRECYDQQTGALNEVGDNDINRKTGAIAAIAAHDMCKDQVMACAALYGDTDGCIYDDASKTLTQREGKVCGLQSLLAYVNTVDSVRVAQGCELSLREYAEELCADTAGTGYGYPWGCRLRGEEEIAALLRKHAADFCGADLIVQNNDEIENTETGGIIKVPMPGPGEEHQAQEYEPERVAKRNTIKGRSAVRNNTVNNKNNGVVPRAASGRVVARAGKSSATGGGNNRSGNIDQNIVVSITDVDTIVNSIMADIRNNLSEQLGAICRSVTGDGQLFWASTNSMVENSETISVSPTWMKTVFGTDSDLGWLDTRYGVCGYQVKNAKTAMTRNLKCATGESPTFSWGLCMRPTEKQICDMELSLPGMSSEYIKYENKKCQIKSDKWYEIRCQQIDGYWSGGQCYVR